MKKILLFCVFAAAAFLFWKCTRVAVPSNSSSPGQKEEILKVQRGNISTYVQATATITPENKLEIKSAIAGRAESVNVDIGEKVKQGQVLAMMSSEERAALLDAARAKGEKEVKFWQDVYKAAPLVAPLDGEIISRTLVPGQVVQSTDVVFIMSDHLIAEANMDETDLSKVFLGQKADVTLDSYPGKKIPGEVFKIAYNSTTTNNVTTYSVDVALKPVPDYARSGMTANVSFLIAEKKDVLLLPSDAITSDNTVLLPPAKAGGESLRQPVSTGLTNGKEVEITDGLKEGQEVLRYSYSLPSQASQGISILPRMGRRTGSSTSR